MPLMPLKLAIVGAGHMADHFHLPALAKCLEILRGGAELSGVIDPDEGKRTGVMKRWRVARGYACVSEMLDEMRPDAALVLVPYRLNGQVALELMKHGIHMLMEKPPAMSKAQMNELRALAREKNCIVQVGYNRRHWPAMKTALEWIGESGQPIQHMRGTKHRTNRINEDYVFYTFSHVLDLLLSVGGEVVQMQTIRQHIPSTEAFNFFITLGFRDGAVAQATGMPHVSFNQEFYEFHTLDSTVAVDQRWGTEEPAMIWQSRGQHVVRRAEFSKGNERLETDGFTVQYSVFLHALLHGGRAWPSLDDCAPTIELAEALRAGRSWEADTGCPTPSAP